MLVDKSNMRWGLGYLSLGNIFSRLPVVKGKQNNSLLSWRRFDYLLESGQVWGMYHILLQLSNKSLLSLQASSSLWTKHHNQNSYGRALCSWIFKLLWTPRFTAALSVPCQQDLALKHPEDSLGLKYQPPQENSLSHLHIQLTTTISLLDIVDK